MTHWSPSAPEAEPVFADALGSEIASVRVASCFGVAGLSEPERARRLLEPLLGDGAARCGPLRRSPWGRSEASGSRKRSRARRETSRRPFGALRPGALGSYDDPQGVALAVNALLDPDRDTAVRAGESLVRLSRRSLAGEAARHALRREESAWPVERALTLSSLGRV